MWKYSSFWFKDFDAMALKTMLRQLISKWGIMSIDMQKGYESDIGMVTREDGTVEYVDVENGVAEDDGDKIVDMPEGHGEVVQEQPATATAEPAASADDDDPFAAFS